MKLVGFFLATAVLAACGNAEIVAPEMLAIVDTYPGNGSLVAADEKTIAVAFSLDVEPSTLSGVSLEETGAGAVRPIALSMRGYDASTFTATYESEPLPADSIFALTVSASVLRAKSGSQLRADVRRMFRTASENR